MPANILQRNQGLIYKIQADVQRLPLSWKYQAPKIGERIG